MEKLEEIKRGLAYGRTENRTEALPYCNGVTPAQVDWMITKLELLDRYKKVLEGLTPGGSEYIDDPERCAEAIRFRWAGPVTILKRQAARLKAAEEMARALKTLHANKGWYLSEDDDQDLADSVYNDTVDALSAWDTAGKGEG